MRIGSAGLVCLGLLLLFAFASPSRAQTGNVLVGDMSVSWGRGILLHFLATDLAQVVKNRAEGKGHAIVRNDNASSDDAVAASRMANGRILVIFGHGLPEPHPPPDYDATIMMTPQRGMDDPFAPTRFFVNEVFNTYQYVIFHSCGQFKDKWSRRYSGQFTSWAGPTNIVLIDREVNDKWYDAPPAGANFAATDTIMNPELVDLHGLVPELAPRCGSTMGQPGPIAEIGTPDNPLLRMGASLASAFGSKVFNVFTADTAGVTDSLPVFGAQVHSGYIVSWMPRGYPSTDFDVAISGQALRQAYTVDPSSILTAYQTGGVTIQNHTGGATPDSTLFKGVAAVMFGINATEITPCTISGVDIPDAPPPSVGDLRVGAASPNPFWRFVGLSFETLREGTLQVDVFDVAGRRIRSLEERRVEATPHHVIWDGMTDRGKRAARGIYFIRVRLNGDSVARRVVLQ